MKRAANGVRLQDRSIIRDMRKRLKKCAGANCTLLIGFLIAINIIRYGLFFLLELLPVSTDHIKYIYNPALYIAVYIICFPLFIKISNRKRPEAIDMVLHKKPNRRFPTFRWVIIGIGATQILSYLMKGVFLVLEIITGLNLLDVNTTVQPENINRIVSLLILGFLAPFMEELLYRGTLMKNTVRYGEWFAIISTGVVSGLLFVQIDQAANAIVLGIVCGFVMVKAKSVWPAILVHMGYSAIRIAGFCLSGWGSNKKGNLIYKAEIPKWVEIGEIALTVLSVALIVSAILFLILEMKKNREIFELEDAMPGLSTGQKVTAYLTAPATMLYVAASVALMVINIISGLLIFR